MSLPGIKEEKFILEELAIQRVARMLHHGIDAGIFIIINVTVAPKNKDSQEREFGQTLLALSLE